ncbi:Uncharacterised protein [Vibrio cholerae]|nr:Uncharacterised protein [Vibrio cholerae]
MHVYHQCIWLDAEYRAQSLHQKQLHHSSFAGPPKTSV